MKNDYRKKSLKALLNQDLTPEQGRQLLKSPSGRMVVFIANRPDGKWYDSLTGQLVNPDTYQPEKGTTLVWEENTFEDRNAQLGVME